MPYRQQGVVDYSIRIAASFRHWTGHDLFVSDSAEGLAYDLYYAPFVVLSHGAQAEPLFCYANRTAQKLFNMPWEKFIGLPSRLSALMDAQEERERMLKLAERQGYIAGYRGVRVTADGQKFRIKDAILWNVMDESLQNKIGQAATFSEWEWL